MDEHSGPGGLSASQGAAVMPAEATAPRLPPSDDVVDTPVASFEGESLCVSDAKVAPGDGDLVMMDANPSSVLGAKEQLPIASEESAGRPEEALRDQINFPNSSQLKHPASATAVAFGAVPASILEEGDEFAPSQGLGPCALKIDPKSTVRWDPRKRQLVSYPLAAQPHADPPGTKDHSPTQLEEEYVRIPRLEMKTAVPPMFELEAASGTACVSGDIPGNVFPQLNILESRQFAVDLSLEGNGRDVVSGESHPPGYEIGKCEDVSCLYIPEGFIGDRVSTLLHRGFTGVRRLTLAATCESGLVGIAGLESLVHLQLNFCGPNVISILPEVLETLPGLRRLALIGCQGLDEAFFSQLASSSALLDTVQIETHKSPSEPLYEGATKFLAKMPYLSSLRLVGEVRSFFENTECFGNRSDQEGQAPLTCLDITATEMLCTGTAVNMRASTGQLSSSLSHLRDLRYLRLNGIYPNYVPALRALGMLRVAHLVIFPRLHDQTGERFSLFHDADETKYSNLFDRDELDEWEVGTCDTLRLNSPILFSKQLADIRQGFPALRCLDLAWDECISPEHHRNMPNVGNWVVAQLVGNFENLEILRISSCARSYIFPPNFSFLRILRKSPKLRELHAHIFDLSEDYPDPPRSSNSHLDIGDAQHGHLSNVSIETLGRKLGDSLKDLQSLRLFSVACPIANEHSVNPEQWNLIEREATRFLKHNGSARSVSQKGETSPGHHLEVQSYETTNVFSDWASLFRQGGVPEL